MVRKALALGIAMSLAIAVPTHAEQYATLFKVTEVQGDNIDFTDSMGYVYRSIEDDGDIEVGDYYTAVMEDMGTPTIEDDIIMSLRYVRVDLLERR